MKSALHIFVEKYIPHFFATKIIHAGKAYKRSRRHTLRVKRYGGDKPFPFSVNTLGVSFKIIIDPVHNCVVDAEIEQSGFWENGVCKAIMKYLPNNGVFLDIGTNIGYHSLLVASYLQGKGEVYSFEPLPRLFKQFTDSIALNGFTNIIPNNVGLAEKDGEHTIFLREENIAGSSLFNFTDKIDNFIAAEQEVIQLKKLDTFLPHLTHVDVIKIDVEGYEYEALQGAKELLTKSHPIIFMEFSPLFYFQDYEEKTEDLLVFLETLGYHFFTLDEQPLDLRSWMKLGNNKNFQCDVLCKYKA